MRPEQLQWCVPAPCGVIELSDDTSPVEQPSCAPSLAIPLQAITPREAILLVPADAEAHITDRSDDDLTRDYNTTLAPLHCDEPATAAAKLRSTSRWLVGVKAAEDEQNGPIEQHSAAHSAIHGAAHSTAQMLKTVADVVRPHDVWRMPFKEVESLLANRAGSVGRSWGIATPPTRIRPRFHMRFAMLTSMLGGRVTRGRVVLFRTMMLAFWTSWLASVHWRGVEPQCLLYLVNWCSVLLEAYLVLMLAFVLVWRIPNGDHAIIMWHRCTCKCALCHTLYYSSIARQCVPRLAKACWMMRSMLLATTVVTLLSETSDWLVVSEAVSTNLPRLWRSQAGAVAVVLLDVALSDMTVDLSDGWHGCGVFGLYAAFSLIFHATGGRAERRRGNMYAFLDWSGDWMRSALSVVCILWLLFPLVQVVITLWHRLFRRLLPSVETPPWRKLGDHKSLPKQSFTLDPSMMRRCANISVPKDTVYRNGRAYVAAARTVFDVRHHRSARYKFRRAYHTLRALIPWRGSAPTGQTHKIYPVSDGEIFMAVGPALPAH